ncbi:hypothetical protein HHI36_010390 [Cryptolaemus montrouzieri]|uniref:Uncharacterized protein n=1 Tax=Cryptolaemus montrouzieri TaxID=559131 RepID=A0ABD2MIQ1_9CUCU
MDVDQTWKDDVSSESDPSKQEDDVSLKARSSNHTSVKFSVGDDCTPSQETVPSFKSSKTSLIPRTCSNNNTSLMKPLPMKKSYSQDTTFSLLSNAAKAKSIEFEFASSAADSPLPLRSVQSKDQCSTSLEEDICSTDSSLLDEELKKRKRKFFNLKKKKSKNE